MVRPVEGEKVGPAGVRKGFNPAVGCQIGKKDLGPNDPGFARILDGAAKARCRLGLREGRCG